MRVRLLLVALLVAGAGLVATGVGGYGTGTAAADETAATGYPAKAELAGRDRKSTAATEVRTHAAGSTVEITCQAYGEWAYGSFIWDRTTDDLWVADHYVKTGYAGFVPGMPRCDGDQPSEPPQCAPGHGRIDGPAGPSGGTVEEKIARVLDVARSQTGRDYSYAWGGGGKGGASCGIAAASPGGYVDYARLGYDCSGYTLHAYWKGAGFDIGAHTGAQYGTGRKVPYGERRPGDLILFGTDGVTSHVGLYVGDDRMLQAAPPRGTTSVGEVAVPESNRFASVVRVFG